MKIHDLRMFADRAYDITQTREGIKDGDVLRLSDNMFGIMVKAWPCYLEKYDGRYHHFHHPDKHWSEFEGGKYKEAADVAFMLSQM